MESKVFGFSELEDAPLLIDAVYKGGNGNSFGSEPLHALLPHMQTQGGFRPANRKDKKRLPAYVVIWTTGKELAWPDHLDVENGIFLYYGDNRFPGKEMYDTKKKGNTLLRNVFEWLENNERLVDIPPFLIFRGTGIGRDVRFLGLAAPGNVNVPPDRDLVAIWRTMDGQRFQNYEAHFTILDTKNENISKEWLKTLVNDHENNLSLAPNAWKEFIKKGRYGINPLVAPKITKVENKIEQLPEIDDEKNVLESIRGYYRSDPWGFEYCATRIIQMLDPQFIRFDLTRPWRDGGRDAIGLYRIGPNEHPLSIDFAMEAKCYSENNSVGVKEMSRLISRIKFRQFGIMITTSYVGKQAYQEVVDDGHPVLIINGKDIANILRRNGINSSNINDWLIH